jgi:hypothetical protein
VPDGESACSDAMSPAAGKRRREAGFELGQSDDSG